MIGMFFGVFQEKKKKKTFLCWYSLPTPGVGNFFL